MMSAIYKRYKEIELGEVLVAGGVVAEGSVDRRQQDKHFKRGLRYMRLMYEALTRQLVKGKLTPDLDHEASENLQIVINTSLSQKSRVAAHATLAEDADLESLITNIFTQTEGSVIADYWRNFLGRADAECARTPRLQLGRVRQLSERHAAIDGSVRQQ